MRKITLLFLILSTCIFGIAFATSNNSTPEVLPNMDNNPTNTAVLNDQLRQMQSRIQTLEGGISLSAGVTGILPVVNGGTGQDMSGVAANAIPYFSSTGVIGNIGIGTTGYVLTAAAPPTWSAPAHGATLITATGTTAWVAPPGVYGVWLTLQGAGSSGAADSSSACVGGASGAYIDSAFYPVTPGNSYNVVVGAGGVGVSGGHATPNSGGNSSFDSNLVANGATGNSCGSGCCTSTAGTVQSASNMAGSSTTGGSQGYDFGVQIAGALGGAHSGGTGGGGAASIFGAGPNGQANATHYGTGGGGATGNGTSGAGFQGVVFIRY